MEGKATHGSGHDRYAWLTISSSTDRCPRMQMRGQRHLPVLGASLLCGGAGNSPASSSTLPLPATSPSSPCRSLQRRHLLPAPSLGRYCRNYLSYNGFLARDRAALAAFLRITLQFGHFAKKGGVKVRPGNCIVSSRVSAFEVVDPVGAARPAERLGPNAPALRRARAAAPSGRPARKLLGTRRRLYPRRLATNALDFFGGQEWVHVVQLWGGDDAVHPLRFKARLEFLVDV